MNKTIVISCVHVNEHSNGANPKLTKSMPGRQGAIGHFRKGKISMQEFWG